MSEVTVSPQPSGNRWAIAAAAVVMQMCLGVLYAWSVFRTPLAQLHPTWSKADTIAPYRYSLLCFTIAMVLAGMWQDRKGPRIVGSFGGLLLGAGCLIASVKCSTVSGLILAYGVIGGLGVGCAYVTPIATCVKWFPDRRGLIVGLAVMGFGAGTVVFAPLLSGLIGDHKANPALYADSIPQTFRVMAGILFVCVVGAAQMFRVPPAGWKPAGWNPPAAQAGGGLADYSTAQMLATWQIFALWVLYFLGASVGLTVIGEAKPFMERVTDPKTAAAAVGVLALFNGGGRLLWGFVSDKTGRNNATILMCIVYVAAALGLLRGASTYSTGLAGICLVGLSFGGFLALMPAFNADYYGARNFGLNYGLLFSAYGLAGFFVPLRFNQMLAKLPKAQVGQGYDQMFVMFAGAAVVALILAAIVRKPAPKQASA